MALAVEDIDDALKPNPGEEEDFLVADNKFAFSPGHLNKLFNPKSYAAFYSLGGLAGLEKGLRTDRNAGLPQNPELEDILQRFFCSSLQNCSGFPFLYLCLCKRLGPALSINQEIITQASEFAFPSATSAPRW